MRAVLVAVLISSALAHAGPRPQVLLGELSLRPKERWGEAPSVRVKLDHVRFVGLAGHTFFLGTRARAQGGDWSDWQRSEVWSVPTDDFVWDRPLHHFIPHAALAELGGDGPFYEFEAAVFDARTGELLAQTHDALHVRLKLGAPHPSFAAPVNPPLPSPLRACGLPHDDGCVVARHGHFAMDAVRFQGLRTALSQTNNELVRADLCARALRADYLTARQLDALLGLFENELVRLDLAKTAAPHVVDPSRALELSLRFENELLRQDYLQLFLRAP